MNKHTAKDINDYVKSLILRQQQSGIPFNNNYLDADNDDEGFISANSEEAQDVEEHDEMDKTNFLHTFLA